MQTIPVYVTNRVASILKDAYIVADNDEWKVKFIFDLEWKQFSVKAARIFVGEQFTDILFRNDEIILPRLPQDIGKISIGVFAYIGTSENVTFSSTTVDIPVKPSAFADGGGAFVPSEPEVILPAQVVTPSDTFIVNQETLGTKALATIQQILDLVTATGITAEQLRQALAYYRTANAQDIIDSELRNAISTKYTLPLTGIPKNHLAPGVQSSLDKADTALQSAPVTSVNGQTGAVMITVPSTAADVGAATPPKYTTLTLAVADWESSGNAYSCSKTVTGMTATSIVWLSYSDTETEFTEAQSTDTLTFIVSGLPSDAITVNVAFMEGSALS